MSPLVPPNFHQWAKTFPLFPQSTGGRRGFRSDAYVAHSLITGRYASLKQVSAERLQIVWTLSQESAPTPRFAFSGTIFLLSGFHFSAMLD